MDRDLKLLLSAWKWGRSIVVLVFATGSQVATLSAYTAGLLLHDLILIGLWALLAALCCAWMLLILVDRLIDGIARFREGARVARLLSEWSYVGSFAINVKGLVMLWLETAPENKAVKQIKEHTMLRTLKGAVRQGLIERLDDKNSAVDMNTPCSVESAALFFRKRRWLDVKKESEADGAPDASSVSKPIRTRRVIGRGWLDDYRHWW